MMDELEIKDETIKALKDLVEMQRQVVKLLESKSKHSSISPDSLKVVIPVDIRGKFIEFFATDSSGHVVPVFLDVGGARILNEHLNRLLSEEK
jgi:hypothetical protein